MFKNETSTILMALSTLKVKQFFFTLLKIDKTLKNKLKQETYLNCNANMSKFLF